MAKEPKDAQDLLKKLTEIDKLVKNYLDGKNTKR